METESFTLETVMYHTQMNLLEHAITLARDPTIYRMDLKQVRWNWMTSKRAFAQECGSFSNSLSSKMNILVWNFRGAMKPSFHSTIRDLTNFHSPGIMVVTETRISDSKVDDIICTLPYDGIHTTDPIGYAGEIWLLWHTDMVDLNVLATTEQEIHAIVKVLTLPLPGSSHLSMVVLSLRKGKSFGIIFAQFLFFIIFPSPLLGILMTSWIVQKKKGQLC